jgi:Raf kinase inhibitor-like YbhB/YbcL family protein
MHHSEMEKEFKPLIISSPAFPDSGSIPSKYTCEGEDINPPLEIGNIPEGVISLAIIVDDPDAPRGTWLHWLVWGIPITHHIKENEVPGIEGVNDFGRTSYGGPCPPSGTHHYFFRVYGLNAPIHLRPGASRRELEQAMRDHILAYGELVGLYRKTGKRVKRS